MCHGLGGESVNLARFLTKPTLRCTLKMVFKVRSEHVRWCLLLGVTWATLGANNMLKPLVLLISQVVTPFIGKCRVFPQSLNANLSNCES